MTTGPAGSYTADCAPFLRAVATARDLPVSHVLPGAGSSALVFLALGR